MSTPKMQHCFNCGADLGVYVKHFRDLDTCGEVTCERERRAAERAEDEEAQEAAREDQYDRYRR